MATDAEMFAYFEKKGLRQVRLWLQGRKLHSAAWEQAANRWVATHAQGADHLTGAFQVDQIEIARAASGAAERAADAGERAAAAAGRAAKAAERASTNTIITLMVAVISVFAIAISLWMSRPDTGHSGASDRTPGRKLPSVIGSTK
jgi:hypothetical protein